MIPEKEQICSCVEPKKSKVKFDKAKVDRIKRQIANGSYVIDVEIIADRLFPAFKALANHY